MPSRQPSVLLICHVSAVEVSVTAVRQLYADSEGNSDADSHGRSRAVTQIDLLCYGLASHDHPPPPGARLVGPPVQENASQRDALRMLTALRRRRYDVVALSQPALGLSRARGLLVAYAYLVSGGSSVILDPLARRVVGPVRLGLMVKDLARWMALQLVSRGVAAVAVKPMARLAARAGVARTPASRGSVVYLRTDMDLSIAPLRAGGSVAHTEGILQALLKRGHETAYWGTGEVDGVPASIPRLRLPVLLKGNFPMEVAEFVSGVIQGCAGRRWLRAPASRPTGFIYQRYSLNNLAGVILSRRWGVPLVLEANGSEARWRQDFGTLKYPKLAYACERLILRRADVVAAVSANAAEDLLTSGAPPERVRVVPNGVSVERFAGATPMALSDGLADAFVVCFVGLFYPWHGVRFLAEAFALLHRRHADARLLLVGDGEEAPVSRSVLQRHDVLAAVNFTGLVPRPEVPRYMAASDVLVSPHANVHRFIGSPIKVFEYMAAGKPIVATRVGQLQDVLTDGETALLVPPEDPEALAGALERLYFDRELGERLGRSAQSKAASRHSWDARLAAILDSAQESVRGGDSA